MGHFGFSYVGLAYLAMLFIPNAIWAKNKPEGYDPSGESKWLLVLERVGQVCVTCCALVFKDFNLSPLSLWSLWLVASAAAMAAYEWFWVRYFRGPRTVHRFYQSLGGIPVPGATLPVAGFLFLGIYGKVIWMVLSITLLGIGHIGIHFQHRKKLRQT